MCEMCKKTEFALESLWQLVTTNDLCEAMYSLQRDHASEMDIEQRTHILDCIKGARANEQKFVDQLRTLLLAYVLTKFLAESKAPLRHSVTMLHGAIQCGLNQRIDKM